MGSTLSPRLASVHDEMTAATALMHQIVDPLDDTAWRRRPDGGGWCVAECIEHLNMSSAALIPMLRDRIRDARAHGLVSSQPRYRLDFIGWFLCKSLEPPPRSRFKTTDTFVPPAVLPKGEVVEGWQAHQLDLAGLLAEAEGVTLNKVKITSPFNARVRYNAYSAMRVTVAHQRRHLWQASRVLETTGNVPR